MVKIEKVVTKDVKKNVTRYESVNLKYPSDLMLVASKGTRDETNKKIGEHYADATVGKINKIRKDLERTMNGLQNLNPDWASELEQGGSVFIPITTEEKVKEEHIVTEYKAKTTALVEHGKILMHIKNFTDDPRVKYRNQNDFLRSFNNSGKLKAFDAEELVFANKKINYLRSVNKQVKNLKKKVKNRESNKYGKYEELAELKMKFMQQTSIIENSYYQAVEKEFDFSNYKIPAGVQNNFNTLKKFFVLSKKCWSLNPLVFVKNREHVLVRKNTRLTRKSKNVFWELTAQ
jgi:hypothetical protein